MDTVTYQQEHSATILHETNSLGWKVKDQGQRSRKGSRIPFVPSSY